MNGRFLEEMKAYAFEIVSVTHNPELGELREDAVMRVIERLAQSSENSSEYQTKLIELVRCLGAVLMAFSDEEQRLDLQASTGTRDAHARQLALRDATPEDYARASVEKRMEQRDGTFEAIGILDSRTGNPALQFSASNLDKLEATASRMLKLAAALRNQTLGKASDGPPREGMTRRGTGNEVDR